MFFLHTRFGWSNSLTLAFSTIAIEDLIRHKSLTSGFSTMGSYKTSLVEKINMTSSHTKFTCSSNRDSNTGKERDDSGALPQNSTSLLSWHSCMQVELPYCCWHVTIASINTLQWFVKESGKTYKTQLEGKAICPESEMNYFFDLLSTLLKVFIHAKD